jgi:hypothetical protein
LRTVYSRQGKQEEALKAHNRKALKIQLKVLGQWGQSIPT